MITLQKPQLLAGLCQQWYYLNIYPMNCRFLFFVSVCIFCLGGACKKGSSGTGSVAPPAVTNTDSSFAKGADISWLTQMEESGYHFYDSSGQQMDCMQVLQGIGLNAIRLRAWVNPAAGWCGTPDLVQKAVRAKNLGFKILIDFHYSDVWADPGDQTKPVAWDSLDFNSLDSTMYQYTAHVMDTLKQNGVVPQWAQIGNETNDGFLWEDGRASTNIKNFVTLINSGYAAVKSIDDSTKIIVHISNGYDNSLFRWVFDSLQTYGANWDIIGMSLYPSSTDWQTLDQECLANMNDMVSRYGKPVMICEVGMDVTAVSACQSFLADIITKTKSLGKNFGLGVFYWEPESYDSWQGYTLGAFDNTGKPTAALTAFMQN
jgi:arabinogalactan endo-1,4-beta-galactosidase